MQYCNGGSLEFVLAKENSACSCDSA